MIMIITTEGKKNYDDDNNAEPDDRPTETEWRTFSYSDETHPVRTKQDYSTCTSQWKLLISTTLEYLDPYFVGNLMM